MPLTSEDVSRLVELSHSESNKADWLEAREIDIGFMTALLELAMPAFILTAEESGLPLALQGAIGWAFGIGWLAKEASCSSDSPPS